MGYQIGTLFPRVAARLNDPNQTLYTNAVLLPYAQDAGDELQAELELNGVLVLETISAIIVVPQITNFVPGQFVSLAQLNLLPADMLEPQTLKERLSGSPDMFLPMVRRMWTPDILPTDFLRYWDYRNEDIFLLGCNNTQDVLIEYLQRRININSITDPVNVNNSQQFMINRIAAMAARYIGENPTRADELDKVAQENMNWLLGIAAKSKQGTRTRRRPFVLVGRRRWV
jgi:hypothetical protein